MESLRVREIVSRGFGVVEGQELDRPEDATALLDAGQGDAERQVLGPLVRYRRPRERTDQRSRERESEDDPPFVHELPSGTARKSIAGNRARVTRGKDAPESVRHLIENNPIRERFDPDWIGVCSCPESLRPPPAVTMHPRTLANDRARQEAPVEFARPRRS
jgi:hypothetical protein